MILIKKEKETVNGGAYPPRKRRAPSPVIVTVLLILVAAGGFGLLRLSDSAAVSAAASGTGERGETAAGGSASQSPAPVQSQEAEEQDWRLRLVNRWHTLPADYEPVLAELDNGQSVDERCYPELAEMLGDCRAAGLDPLVCSSYRSRKVQESLYFDKVRRLEQQGLSPIEAEEQAGTEVAVPGTSEHQLGLAVDIVDTGNQNLDESQEQTAVQQWLMENSWKYGFVLRFPSGKSEITGIIYEPWHYRYVGKEAAKEMFEADLCLEEYLGKR